MNPIKYMMNNTRAEDALCFIARFALSKAMVFSFFTVRPFMTKMYAHYETIPIRRGRTHDRLINKAEIESYTFWTGILMLLFYLALALYSKFVMSMFNVLIFEACCVAGFFAIGFSLIALIIIGVICFAMTQCGRVAFAILSTPAILYN